MNPRELAQWWRPEQPSIRHSGTLYPDADGEGLRLLLDGYFFQSEDSDESTDSISQRGQPLNDIPILVGITADGKFISLIDCQLLKTSLFAGMGKTLQVFKPSLIAYDVHFSGKDDFQLTSLDGRYSNIDEWASTTGASVSFPTKEHYNLIINYSRPQNLWARLPDGLEVGVGFSVEGPSLKRSGGVCIHEKTWLCIRSSELQPYWKLQNALNRMADLVSLGIGQSIRISDLNATTITSDSAASKDTFDFRIEPNAPQIAPVREDLGFHRMLFTLKDIRENFSEIVSRWFSLHEALEPLHNLYFGTMRSPWMYVEQRFMNMFQALESFDRRAFTLEPEKRQSHDEKVARILDAVQSKRDRDWLKGKLRYSHEPTAVARLRRLVKQYGAQWVFDESSDDLELVGHIRNFYTHYDGEVSSRLPAQDARPAVISNAAARLQILCEVILLQEVGFRPEQIRQRMQETNRLERMLVKHTRLS